MQPRDNRYSSTEGAAWRGQRRAWLAHSACGFGAMAAAAMFHSVKSASADETQGSTLAKPIGDKLHHSAKAKRVIFLFMQGGVSQVDSFDHKPHLAKHHGETLVFNDARALAKIGKPTEQRLMQSPWSFRPYGQTGKMASDLFPNMAEHADDLTFIHSMHTEGVAHGPATLFLHCGATTAVRPSMGSWVLYGLGSENDNLPGFISIAPSVGNGGSRNYGQAFLPAQFQGTRIGLAGSSELGIQSLTRNDISAEDQARQLALLEGLNRRQIERRSVRDNELDAVLDSYELAWRMQSAGPDWLDLSKETPKTHELYGLNDPKTEIYGRRCLLARRLCEAGVRFIQVNYGDNSANPAWDQHSNLRKHADHAYAVDRPIAGLLTDLKRRGLLDDTIVWWGSEFGRTPYAQDNGTGRDHNPLGFTVWLAGGGFKPGMSYGQTDEFGAEAIHDKVHMHDLHATMLYQLGLDHRRLTYLHAGREFRLTDVHGHVVTDVVEPT